MTHTSVWVKNTKVMPQNPAIYLFSWEREGILTSPNFTKFSKVHFLPCPQHANHSDSDTVWMTHAKINKN